MNVINIIQLTTSGQSLTQKYKPLILKRFWHASKPMQYINVAMICRPVSPKHWLIDWLACWLQWLCNQPSRMSVVEQWTAIDVSTTAMHCGLFMYAIRVVRCTERLYRVLQSAVQWAPWEVEVRAAAVSRRTTFDGVTSSLTNMTCMCVCVCVCANKR